MINFSDRVDLPTIPSSLFGNQTALEKWATDNIGEYISVDVVDITDQRIHNTDVPYTLYYIIENSKGVLNMWHEWGKTVQRNELVEIDSKERVIRIDGGDLPNNSWWLVYSKVIHNFERMDTKISAIRIKLNTINI